VHSLAGLQQCVCLRAFRHRALERPVRRRKVQGEPFDLGRRACDLRGARLNLGQREPRCAELRVSFVAVAPALQPRPNHSHCSMGFEAFGLPLPERRHALGARRRLFPNLSNSGELVLVDPLRFVTSNPVFSGLHPPTSFALPIRVNGGRRVPTPIGSASRR